MKFTQIAVGENQALQTHILYALDDDGNLYMNLTPVNPYPWVIIHRGSESVDHARVGMLEEEITKPGVEHKKQKAKLEPKPEPEPEPEPEPDSDEI